MDATFWAGTLVGGFVGIMFTFLARPLERVLDRHGDRVAADRGARILEATSKDTQVTRDWLVVQLIEIAVVGAIAGIGAGIFFTAQSVLAYSSTSLSPEWEVSRVWQATLLVIGQTISVLGAAIVLRLATTASRTARLLRAGKIRKSAR